MPVSQTVRITNMFGERGEQTVAGMRISEIKSLVCVPAVDGRAANNENVSSINVAGKGMAALRVSSETAAQSEQLFVCTFENCGRGFKDRRTLRKHALTHQPRRFHCEHPECGKSFYERAKLRRHMLVHSGEKSFECPHPGCEKRFALKANMQTHLRVHTGLRPYACPFPGCDRSFSQTSGRNSHYKIHFKTPRTMKRKDSTSSVEEADAKRARQTSVSAASSNPAALSFPALGPSAESSLVNNSNSGERQNFARPHSESLDSTISSTSLFPPNSIQPKIQLPSNLLLNNLLEAALTMGPSEAKPKPWVAPAATKQDYSIAPPSFLKADKIDAALWLNVLGRLPHLPNQQN